MLGPEGRGEFAAILLWPSVIATLGLFGIHFVLARKAGKDGDNLIQIGESVLVSLLTGLISVSFCILLVPYLIPEKNQYLLQYIIIFSIFIPLFHIRTNLAAVDQGKGNFKLLNLSRTILYPVFFVGLVYSWYFSEDRLLGAVIALLIGNGAVILFRLFAAFRLDVFGSVTLSPLKLFREGLPYQATVFLQLSSQYVDQILLLWLLNPVDLAMYVVARSSASVISSLPSSLGLISLSQATQLDRDTGFLPLAQMLRRGGMVVIFSAVCIVPFFTILIPLNMVMTSGLQFFFIYLIPGVAASNI